VELFFAISGFLITTMLLRERRATGVISLRRFYVRRSLRIFPLYFAVLGVYTLLAVTYGRNLPASAEFLSRMPSFLTYTMNIFVVREAMFGFTWSLAIEEQFYCVWPWVETYCVRAAAAVMCAGTIAVYVLQSGWIALPAAPKLLIDSVALPICFGVLVAHVLSTPRGYRLMFRLVGYRAAPLLAVACTMALIVVRADIYVPGIPYALIVAACVIREDHWASGILASRPFVAVGRTSYGMYLIHGLVYHAVESIGVPAGLDRYGIPMFALAVALTFVGASLVYRYYESFFLGLKERFV
jgi:peptidoglycan/LPS O-acetylase OafA/YrhL